MAKIVGFEILTRGMVDTFYAMDENGQLWQLEQSQGKTPAHELKWQRYAKPISPQPLHNPPG